MKPIAVKGMQLTFLPFTNPQWQVKTEPSDTTTVDDNGVYFDKVKIQLVSATAPSGSFVSADEVALEGTAQYTKIDDKPVLLLGDNAKGNAKVQSGSTTTTIPFICQIQDAGQTVMQGE